MSATTKILWAITFFSAGILGGKIISDELQYPTYISETTPTIIDNSSDEITKNTKDDDENNKNLEEKQTQEKTFPPKKLFSDIDVNKLEKVYKILEKNFVEPEKITSKKLEEWIIRGILYSVEDNYTDYFNEDQSEEFKNEMKGDFEGVGAVLEKRKKILYITEVLKNRPAARAGLLPGDIIFSVDGKEVSDETIWETVLRIRGEKNTDVTLEIIRKGEKKEITATRKIIHVESVELSWEGKNKDIAVLEVNQFGDDLIKEFEKAFNEMKQKKYSSIIVDMRYNGGGYMQGAVDLASYFLPANKTVLMIETKNGIEETLKTNNQKNKDISSPLIILTNGGTASSAEIFTASLTEHNRAKTVGEKTFGKGVVQQLFPLQLGSDEFVKITIAKWLTPNKKNVTHKEPLIPNTLIEWDRSEMTEEQFSNDYDPQLEKAVEILEK